MRKDGKKMKIHWDDYNFYNKKKKDDERAARLNASTLCRWNTRKIRRRMSRVIVTREVYFALDFRIFVIRMQRMKNKQTKNVTDRVETKTKAFTFTYHRTRARLNSREKRESLFRISRNLANQKHAKTEEKTAWYRPSSFFFGHNIGTERNSASRERALDPPATSMEFQGLFTFHISIVKAWGDEESEFPRRRSKQKKKSENNALSWLTEEMNVAQPRRIEAVNYFAE